jgi:hypothetical protein
MGQFNDFIPTPRLRWVATTTWSENAVPKALAPGVAEDQLTYHVLQQWWAEDMPGYMRNQAKGEWRDVPAEDTSA